LAIRNAAHSSAHLLVEDLVSLVDIRDLLVSIVLLLPLDLAHAAWKSASRIRSRISDVLLIDLTNHSVNGILARLAITVAKRVGASVQVFGS
jgi:hypothetical protein